MAKSHAIRPQQEGSRQVLLVPQEPWPYMTEKCKSLKKNLEDLVKKNLIPKFVKETGNHKKGTEQVEIAADVEAVRVINCIYGVLDSSSLSNKSIRSSFQKVRMHEQTSPSMVMSITSDKRPKEELGEPNQLSFSDKDLQGVETPHNDALVITLK